MLQSRISEVLTVAVNFVCTLKPCKIGIKSVYTDFGISPSRWEQFIKTVRSDWAESILYVSISRLLYYSMTDASHFDRALCC